MSEELPEGQLPEFITGREKIIDEIRNAGIPLNVAFKALIEATAAVLNVRISDTGNALPPPSEKAEVVVINSVTELGFDPHNRQQLIEARKALYALRNLFVPEK